MGSVGLEQVAHDLEIPDHASTLGRGLDLPHAAVNAMPHLARKKPFRLRNVPCAELVDNCAVFRTQASAFIQVMLGAHAAAPCEKLEVTPADGIFELRTSGKGDEKLMKMEIRLGHAANITFPGGLVHQVTLPIKLDQLHIRKPMLARDAKRKTLQRHPYFVRHHDVFKRQVTHEKTSSRNAFNQPITRKAQEGVMDGCAPHLEGFAKFQFDETASSGDLAFADGVTQLGIREVAQALIPAARFTP